MTGLRQTARRAARVSWRRTATLTAVAAVIALGAGGGAPVVAQERPTEYQVKAAFLFNFAKFVEWPGPMSSAAEPMAICVVGEDPFGPSLDALTRGERVNGREIVARRLKSSDDLRACHLLFISGSERRRLTELLEHVQGAGVLTVSDIDDFVRAGGMIQLIKQNYRIGFAINAQAAERGRLRISSKLLSLAANKPGLEGRVP